MSPEPERSPVERRRTLRFTPQGARITARKTGTIVGLLGGAKDDYGGDVLDVSALGVRWVGTRKAELGLRVRIAMTYKDCKPFDGTAVVKWSHPHTQPGRFVVGVEYERLSDDQLAQLETIQQAVARDQRVRSMPTPTPAPQPVIRPPEPPAGPAPEAATPPAPPPVPELEPPPAPSPEPPPADERSQESDGPTPTS